MSDAGRDACALWIAAQLLPSASWCRRGSGSLAHEGLRQDPTLDVLGCLVRRPLPTASVTPAAIFRVIESYGPTLLIDEADTFLSDNEELRGMLNSGHRRGGGVLRIVGEQHAPRAFATYGPCAIALIGALPDTLHDRAITIDLKRRLASEKVAPFRSDRAEHLAVLARQAARWTADNAERVAAIDPEMPATIINREADNWRPLVAIADAAAGSGRSGHARQCRRRTVPAPATTPWWSCCSLISGMRSTARIWQAKWPRRRWRRPIWSRPWSPSRGAHGRSLGGAARRSLRTSLPACSSRSA